MFEYACEGEGEKFTRCASVDGIREHVTSLQQYSMVKYHLAKYVSMRGGGGGDSFISVLINNTCLFCR